jgi:hypothetical protein
MRKSKKEELIKKLNELAEDNRDIEDNHIKADILLLDYINDKDISDAYNKIEMWYA